MLREERGHTYGVHAQIGDYRDYAILEIDLSLPTTHTRETVFEIIHEMERLQDASRIEARELAAARATALAGYRRWFTTRATTAWAIARLFLRDDTLAAWSARTAAIAEVDAEDVARVAQAWLRPDAAPMLVTCGSLQALDLQNFVPGGTELVLER